LFKNLFLLSSSPPTSFHVILINVQLVQPHSPCFEYSRVAFSNADLILDRPYLASIAYRHTAKYNVSHWREWSGSASKHTDVIFDVHYTL